MNWRNLLAVVKLAAQIIQQLQDAGLLKDADHKQVAMMTVAGLMHMQERERIRAADADHSEPPP